eukprot:m.179938 g.179938  ORF g.179938 m.179938 type:complete len:351 (+) comp18003_c0_seq3:2494-3546(+)
MGLLREVLAVAILAAVFPFFLELVFSQQYEVQQASDSAVVITGCSSGIGRDAAVQLARRGFTVFAGVRKEADRARSLILELPWSPRLFSPTAIARLKRQPFPNPVSLKREGLSTLVPIIMDVSNEESLDEAAAAVRKGLVKTETKLYALINNAGVSANMPIELVPSKVMQTAFDVNVLGVVWTTQRFMPLLRENHGRIINIGSLAGVIAARGRGVYSATKFALEALTDTMRREMLAFGVSVSIVEPGAVKTAIQGKGAISKSQHAADLSQEQRQLYPWYFQAFDKKRESSFKEAPTTQVTTDAILHALTSTHPKTRYVVAGFNGVPGWAISWIAWALPDRVADWVTITLG